MDSKLPIVRGLQSLSPEEAIEAINALPFAYYRASLDGRVLAASSAMIEIFGYDSIDDIIGVEISSCYVEPDGRARFLAALAEGNGIVDDFQAEMLGPRGKFWVSTAARLVLDGAGTPIALEGLTRDITEQRNVFDELGRGAALFQAFAQGADIGVGISTGSGKEIFLNDKLCELLALEPDPSKSILERMSPELQTLSRDARIAVLKGAPAFHQELLIPVGGKKVWRRYSLFPMHTTHSDEPYFCSTVQDIDAQKAQQVQLIQSSKLASIGELAAGIAHEINQPLNVIRLATMNLRNYLQKKSVLDSKSGDTLEKINQQVERAANIVRQLLLYGREAGDKENYCDPVAAVENAEQMVRQTLKVEDIALAIETSDQSLAVPCNLIKLEQVLMNLIGNAKDAILEQRRILGDSSYRGTVTVTLKARTEHIEITVKDNGVGVPDDMRDTVMEPFVTTKPVGSGTGLGLSVSHGIITSAGGTMQFIDQAQGACAKIVMPLIASGDVTEVNG